MTAVTTRPVEPPKLLSKQAIAELYMERPVNVIMLNAGLWFCRAIELEDSDLKLMEWPQAIIYIENAGYNGIRNLEAKLSAFNDFNRS